MFTAVLDVLIVLSAVYVALSCAISWINETLQALLRTRGRYLYTGVLRLLCNDRALTDAVFSSANVSAASDDRLKRNSRPSYIDPKTFSTALWDAAQSLESKTQSAPADDLFKSEVDVFNALRDRVKALASCESRAPLAGVLANLVNRSGDNYAKLLSETEEWFNSQMDRVTGWYRRYTQWFIVIIALLVVSFGGVDSIQIGTVTFGNPELAAKIVQPVSNALDKQSDVGESVYTALKSVDYFGFHLSLNPVENWRGPGRHWEGMLLTLAALSLGGTFWFDVLKNLVNVRQAGAKPAGDKATAGKTTA